MTKIFSLRKFPLGGQARPGNLSSSPGQKVISKNCSPHSLCLSTTGAPQKQNKFCLRKAACTTHQSWITSGRQLAARVVTGDEAPPEWGGAQDWTRYTRGGCWGLAQHTAPSAHCCEWLGNVCSNEWSPHSRSITRYFGDRSEFVNHLIISRKSPEFEHKSDINTAQFTVNCPSHSPAVYNC